jgi:hypothetical protein
MWTKRELVAEALNELALAGLTFDTTPDERSQAIRTLDRMMAGWTTRAVSIGYVQPATPGDSDPDDDSGIQDKHADAVVQGLAVRLCGSYGKQAPLVLMQTAKQAFDALLIEAATPVPQPLPGGVPIGAGYKGRLRPFTTDTATLPDQAGDLLGAYQEGLE